MGLELPGELFLFGHHWSCIRRSRMNGVSSRQRAHPSSAPHRIIRS